MNNKPYLILLLVFFLSIKTNAQNNIFGNITNVDFNRVENSLVITYRLINCSKAIEGYDIKFVLYTNEGKNVITPHTYEGKTENITCGQDNLIKWDLNSENIVLNEDVFIDVMAYPGPNINSTVRVVKSSLIPGLGLYKLGNSNACFLYCIFGYGGIAGSVILNQLANSTYNKYLNSYEVNESDRLFKNAKTYNNLTYIAIGTTAAIWVANIIHTAIKLNQVKKMLTPATSKYYYEISQKFIKGRSNVKHIDNRSPIRITMDEGDKFFKNRDFITALQFYNEAKSKAPNDKNIFIKYERTLSLIDSTTNAKKQYDELLREGDSLFSGKTYLKAKQQYQEALNYNSLASYPKNKIIEIDRILAENLAQENFKKYITSADELFKAKNYTEAKNLYESALNIKQSDLYVIKKVKECQELIEIQNQKQKEIDQRNLIVAADDAFKQKNYETALDLYEQADHLFISLYAESQIKKCEEGIERQKAIIIPLVRRGNILYIKTKLNDQLSFDFIFDTGANNVLVSSDIFITFWKAGLINKNDLVGEEEFSIADGSTVVGYKFILRKVQIGEIVLEDVEASVVSGGSDLLGGSVFDRLGKFSIDYDKQELIIKRK